MSPCRTSCMAPGALYRAPADSMMFMPWRRARNGNMMSGERVEAVGEQNGTPSPFTQFITRRPIMSLPLDMGLAYRLLAQPPVAPHPSATAPQPDLAVRHERGGP